MIYIAYPVHVSGVRYTVFYHQQELLRRNSERRIGLLFSLWRLYSAYFRVIVLSESAAPVTFSSSANLR